MSLNKKLFWGGLGWVLGGPIGGILGYTWASMSNAGSIKNHQLNNSKSTTQAGDFIVSLMVLFAKVMKADKHIDDSEIKVIHTIAGYLNINQKDYESIKAMFIKDTSYAYKILELDSSCNNDEVKKGYRKMANKYHPDKVSHLGIDLQRIAEEKFKAVSNAYQTIKKERNI